MNGDWRSVFWGALPGEFWHSGGHTRMYWYWCWYRYLMNFILEKVHQVLQLSTTWWVPWLTMGWKIVPKPTMDDMALLLSTKGCGEKTWNQCQASLEMSTDGSHQYEKARDCFLLVNYWDWCWLGFFAKLSGQYVDFILPFHVIFWDLWFAPFQLLPIFESRYDQAKKNAFLFSAQSVRASKTKQKEEQVSSVHKKTNVM